MFRPVSSDSSRRLESLIGDARGGSDEAFGRLLHECRQYLMLVANRRLDPALRAKVGPSDLVQETLHDAHLHFESFHGQTWQEFRAWLRRILLNNVTDVARHYQTADKRQISREIPFDDAPIDTLYVDEDKSPSAIAIARERDETLARAIEQLPEMSRSVIRWRNYDRCTFEVIGDRLGRSSEAARKLWVRSLVQLQRLLESSDESF